MSKYSDNKDARVLLTRIEKKSNLIQPIGSEKKKEPKKKNRMVPVKAFVYKNKKKKW